MGGPQESWAWREHQAGSVPSPSQNLQTIYEVLKWVFTVFPQFCLGQGLIELCYNQIQFDLTHSLGVDSYASPFRMSFLGWIFVQLASQGTALLLLRLLLHGDAVQRARYTACTLGRQRRAKGGLRPGGCRTDRVRPARAAGRAHVPCGCGSGRVMDTRKDSVRPLLPASLVPGVSLCPCSALALLSVALSALGRRGS